MQNHDLPLEKFCLTVPTHSVEEPSVLCFRKILVGKKFMDKREGECQDFPSKSSCLIAPKPFVEEPFYAVFQESSGGEKIYG